MSSTTQQHLCEVELGVIAQTLCCVSDGIVLMPIADCVAACLSRLHHLLICDDSQIQISPHTVRFPELSTAPSSTSEQQREQDVIILSARTQLNKSCLWPDLWNVAHTTSAMTSGVFFDGAPCVVFLSFRQKSLIIVSIRDALEKKADSNQDDSCWAVVSLGDVHKEKAMPLSSFPFNVIQNPLDATQVLVTCPQTKSLSTYQLRGRKGDHPVVTAPPLRLVSMKRNFGKWPLGMSHFLGASSSKLQQWIAVVDAEDQSVFLYDLVSESIVAKRQIVAADPSAKPSPKPHRCRYWPKEDTLVMVMGYGDNSLFVWRNISRIDALSADDATSPIQSFTPPPEIKPNESDFRHGRVTSLFTDPINGDLILGWRKATARFTSMNNLGDSWMQKAELGNSPLPMVGLKQPSLADPVMGFI